MAPRALRHKQRNYYFYRKKAGKSADFPAFTFHGRGLDGKRQEPCLLPMDAAARGKAG